VKVFLYSRRVYLNVRSDLIIRSEVLMGPHEAAISKWFVKSSLSGLVLEPVCSPVCSLDSR